jgi:multisubunit Na+/H+ antiporter MnhG subunit
MITLSVFVVLYTIIGLWRFKKLYGHYNIVDEEEEPILRTLLLVLCAIFSFAAVLFLIIKYLP